VLVGRLVNGVTDFSQLQSSVRGEKVQAYRSYVELFQRRNGGCSEDKVLSPLSSGPLDGSVLFVLNGTLPVLFDQQSSMGIDWQ